MFEYVYLWDPLGMVMVDLDPFMLWKTLGSEHIKGRMTWFDTNL